MSCVELNKFNKKQQYNKNKTNYKVLTQILTVNLWFNNIVWY